MLKVAILIAASPTSEFYSQIAAISLALRTLHWSRWTPRLYAYFGGTHDAEAFAKWRPYLREVEIISVSDNRFEREGIWAQCDTMFELAPRDADIILTMDADTLPVANFEAVLDRVASEGLIAGVIAHYPFPTCAGKSPRESWIYLADGLIDGPLDFAFSYSLVEPATANEHLLTPFYVNFGVVFLPKQTFDDVACRYLSMRPALAGRMSEPWFSGQVALTLAITAARAKTWALPMRYNFPNDSIAERRYPEELSSVVVFHYLRTQNFDRQHIFASEEKYSQFLALPLLGVDRAFQGAVRKIMGLKYPFR